MHEPDSIIAHVSIGTANYPAAIAFYDKVLATLGIQKVFEESSVQACAYGRKFPEFWVQQPFNGEAPTVGNGSHFAFLATSKQQVHDFFDAAIAAGGSSEGEPGPRPEYGPQYYGSFARDLDGHKIEAMFWDSAV